MTSTPVPKRSRYGRHRRFRPCARLPVLSRVYGVRLEVSDRYGKALVVESTERRIVRASRYVNASSKAVFELLADPARRSQWDGNGNVADAPIDQRVSGVGDVFMAVPSGGSIRENHVVEFDEGRLIAWMPAEPGADRSVMFGDGMSRKHMTKESS